MTTAISKTINNLRDGIELARDPKNDTAFHNRADEIETRLNAVESMFKLDQSEGLGTIELVSTDILLNLQRLIADTVALGRDITDRQ